MLFQICCVSTGILCSLINGIYSDNFISSGLNFRLFTVIGIKGEFFIPSSEGSFRTTLQSQVEVSWSYGLHMFATRKVLATLHALSVPAELWEKL